MLCTTTNALQTLSTENAESSTPEQKHGSDTLKALYCLNVLLDDKMCSELSNGASLIGLDI